MDWYTRGQLIIVILMFINCSLLFFGGGYFYKGGNKKIAFLLILIGVALFSFAFILCINLTFHNCCDEKNEVTEEIEPENPKRVRFASGIVVFGGSQDGMSSRSSSVNEGACCLDGDDRDSTADDVFCDIPLKQEIEGGSAKRARRKCSSSSKSSDDSDLEFVPVRCTPETGARSKVFANVSKLDESSHAEGICFHTAGEDNEEEDDCEIRETRL